MVVSRTDVKLLCHLLGVLILSRPVHKSALGINALINLYCDQIVFNTHITVQTALISVLWNVGQASFPHLPWRTVGDIHTI